MITKEKLQELIVQLPNEISIDELIERLVLLEQLEKRIQESKDAQVIDEDQLQSEMKEWFK